MEKRCLFGNAKTINKPHCKRRKEVCFIYKDIRTKRLNKTIAEYKASEYRRRQYAAFHRRLLTLYRQPTY